MPTYFEKQSDKYREKILPKDIKSVFVVEAGSTVPWYKYAGKFGYVFGVDEFGASGKPEELFDKYGLNVVSITKKIIKKIKEN